MNVQEIMVSRPLTCGPQSNLAEVAQVMWNGDCGIVPITNRGGKLLGVVTDRDICIATSTQNKAPAEILASELPHGDLYICHPQDNVQIALTLMREHRVRRVPVTADDGTLVGILSLSDLALAAGSKADVTASEVLDALKGICQHRPAVATAAKAAGAGA